MAVGLVVATMNLAVLVFSQVTLSRSKQSIPTWNYGPRPRCSKCPSIRCPRPRLEADLEMARQRAHFRLMSELYRQRRPITKRRRWPATRSAAVVVPITAARKWQQAQEDPS